MKKNLLFLTLVILISSCQKEELEKDIYEDKVYDEELNLYVPKSFYDFDYTVVKELPNPNDYKPILKSGTLPPSSPGGQIVDCRQFVFNRVSGGYEVSKKVPTGYVVTGVAANINSAKNYNSLMLEYRYIYSNGSMGPRFRVWDTDRSLLDPGIMEAWCQCPTNAIATGIKIKGAADVDCMILNYRYHSSTSNRLYGSVFSSIGGCRSCTGVYDQIFVPEEHGLDMNRSVILGIALMAYSRGGTDRMMINTGYLK